MAAPSQPNYSLEVNLEGCTYDVRVNDGPVYENTRGFPVVSQFPVNRWLRNGQNELSLRLLPVPGTASIDDAKCTLIVYKRERGAERATRSEVARLEYPGGPPSRRDGAATLVQSQFSASVPFGLFRWFTSPEIMPGDATMAELVRELEGFHALLEAKNVDAILAAVRERDREDAAASYQTLQEQAANSRLEYSQMFDEAQYTLRPFLVKDLRLRLFGNRRLARVELVSNGHSPLYYLTSDRRSAGYVSLTFCKDASGKWLIIR
jgi:hypothetical protein